MQSIHDIQRRRSSIRNTAQITRAMGLVSTVKFQKVRRKAEEIKPFAETLYKSVKEIFRGTNTNPHLPPSDHSVVLICTSDRGLVGGYHQNILKCLAESGIPRERMIAFVVGNKGKELLMRKGYPVDEAHSEPAAHPDRMQAQRISENMLREYQEGRAGELYLLYTEFLNTVRQETRLLKLFPFEQTAETQENSENVYMNFEPSEEEVKSELLPDYLSGMIYYALLSSAASEHSARMRAMDAASRNAKELLDNLELQYNRARQSAITQELTEIIAGF